MSWGGDITMWASGCAAHLAHAHLLHIIPIGKRVPGCRCAGPEALLGAHAPAEPLADTCTMMSLWLCWIVLPLLVAVYAAWCLLLLLLGNRTVPEARQRDLDLDRSYSELSCCQGCLHAPSLPFRHIMLSPQGLWLAAAHQRPAAPRQLLPLLRCQHRHVLMSQA